MTAYLIKVILCSALLLGLYFLLLEKEKMHRFNRAYLLFSLLLSFVIPLMSIETAPEPHTVVSTIIFINEGLHETVTDQVNTVTKDYNWFPLILPAVYILITGILLVRFCRNLFIVLAKAKTGTIIPYGSARLVLVAESLMPYSFFNYIFIPAKEYNAGTLEKEIICHELSHVKQKHSVDILIMELLLVFAWFNPFFYLYKKAIRLNHEFLADETVVQTFSNTRFYQLLLLNKATTAKNLVLSSPLHYLATKKRLVMMTKTTSARTAAWKKIAVAPLMTAITLLFALTSTSITAQITPDTSGAKEQATPSRPQSKDPKPGTTWIGISIGSTKEGVSQELLDEYQNIIDKYKNTDSNWLAHLGRNISSTDRARMETIFKQMSTEQQSTRVVGFVKQPKPLPKVAPTKEQFESFKNAKTYGVWIDGKKIANSQLDNYTNADFSQVFISKLYGAAKKNVSYSYQVDLMTKKYYQDYYNEAIANNTPMMVVKWGNPSKIKTVP